MQNRLQLAAQAEPYLGKYFSVYQVRNRLLNYTDGEIKEIDHQIAYERNVGIIPDPNAQLLQTQGVRKNQGQGAEMSGDFQGVPGDMDMSGKEPAMGGGGGSISASGGGSAAGAPIAAPM